MFSKCNKDCTCNNCEYFGGFEVMSVENIKFSTLFDKSFVKINNGVVCNNGYRIAIDEIDLKRGYEEMDYVYDYDNKELKLRD